MPEPSADAQQPAARSASAWIAASAARVYALLADLPRLPEWSAQLQRVLWLDERTHPEPDAWFITRNEHGVWAWTSLGRITVAEPARALAWEVVTHRERVESRWRFELHAEEAGTALTAGITLGALPLRTRLAWRLCLGGREQRLADLAADLERVMAGVKSAAEAPREARARD